MDQDVEHDAGLVDGSPQPMLYPGDFEHDLIEMPFAANFTSVMDYEKTEILTGVS